MLLLNREAKLGIRMMLTWEEVLLMPHAQVGLRQAALLDLRLAIIPRSLGLMPHWTSIAKPLSIWSENLHATGKPISWKSFRRVG